MRWLWILLVILPGWGAAQQTVDTVPYPTYLEQTLKLRIEDQPYPCDSIDTLDRTIYYWFYDTKRWYAKVYRYYDKDFKVLSFRFLAHMAVNQDGRWVAIILGNRYDYRKDGQMESIVRFDEGTRSGPAFYYDKNGILRQKGQYLRDVKSGLWWYYQKDGSLRYEVDYGIPPTGVGKPPSTTITTRNANPGFD
jgi:hypothetical protein